MGAGSRKGNSIPHQTSRGSSVYSTGLPNENHFYSAETEGQGNDKNFIHEGHEGKEDRQEAKGERRQPPVAEFRVRSEY